MKIRSVVPFARTDRQTDRHDEANSRFSLFCEKRLKQVKLEGRNLNILPLVTVLHIAFSESSTYYL